jgi:hypothetical protein
LPAIIRARQRRAGEVAEDLVVVDSDHRNIVGHQDIHAPAGVEHLLAPVVVASHDPDRLGQAQDPGGDLLLFVFPRIHRRFRSGLEDVARQTRFVNQLLEEVAAEVHPRITSRRWAAEPEELEAASGKMLEGESDHRMVVDPDSGQTELGDGESQVHRRQPCPADCAGHRALVDAGEDSISLPVLEPQRRRSAQGMRLEIDGPGAVFALVANDPLEEASSVTAGRLDQQGDVGKLPHGRVGLQA